MVLTVQSAINCFRIASFIILGLIVSVLISLYTIVSIPLFIYRFLVTKVFCYYFGSKNLGKAVTLAGSALATELLQPNVPPRCSVVVSFVVEGHISYKYFCQLVKEKWIQDQTESGSLKYPELQQYLGSFMGYMFWNWVPDFHLKNHVFRHKLNKEDSDVNSERFLHQLHEHLLNKPFTPKQSPWEIHVVQNYKNSNLVLTRGYNSDGTLSKELTLCVFRFHHSMADGYAIFNLLLEQLFGIPMDSIFVAKPAPKPESGENPFEKMFLGAAYPFKVLERIGHSVSLIMKPSTIFHVPDDNKSWKQVYGRCYIIPVKKIKEIKNAFGVSFVAVQNAAIAAGLTKMVGRLEVKSRGQISHVRPIDLTSMIAVPVKSHGKKLRNNVMVVLFEIPMKSNLSPQKRLKICEKELQQVKSSPTAILSQYTLKLFSFLPVPLCRLAVRNRYLATGASIVPGPGEELSFHGHRGLAVDYCAGAVEGNAGIGFMSCSYAGYLQICATAENALFSEEDMEKLMGFIYEEVETLHKLAMNKERNRELEKVTII